MVFASAIPGTRVRVAQLSAPVVVSRVPVLLRVSARPASPTRFYPTALVSALVGTTAVQWFVRPVIPTVQLAMEVDQMPALSVWRPPTSLRAGHLEPVYVPVTCTRCRTGRANYVMEVVSLVPDQPRTNAWRARLALFWPAARAAALEGSTALPPAAKPATPVAPPVTTADQLPVLPVCRLRRCPPGHS